MKNGFYNESSSQPEEYVNIRFPTLHVRCAVSVLYDKISLIFFFKTEKNAKFGLHPVPDNPCILTEKAAQYFTKCVQPLLVDYNTKFDSGKLQSILANNYNEVKKILSSVKDTALKVGNCKFKPYPWAGFAELGGCEVYPAINLKPFEVN